MEERAPLYLHLHEAHFVPLRAQSNAYCLSPLHLEGRNKLVVATIRGEISCLEFHSPSAQRPPVFTPVNFTYIPGEKKCCIAISVSLYRSLLLYDIICS